jgi:hypothetical protein
MSFPYVCAVQGPIQTGDAKSYSMAKKPMFKIDRKKPEFFDPIRTNLKKLIGSKCVIQERINVCLWLHLPSAILCLDSNSNSLVSTHLSQLSRNRNRTI